MAKICMLTLEHSPLDDRIFFKEACSLKKHGYDVHILCKADSDGSMWDMGRKHLLNTDGQHTIIKNGIQITGIPDSNSAVQRILFKVFRDEFSIKFIQKAIEIEADVYHAHEPSSAYLGNMITEKLKHAVLVFDMHETWLGDSRKEKLIKGLLLPQLKYMIAANPVTRGHLMKDNLNLIAEVIYNYPQKEYFCFSPEEKNYQNVMIAHDGLLPFNRGLKEMLEALRSVLEKYPDCKLKIVGETLGEEKEYLENYLQKHRLNNDCVTETGWVSYEKVPEMLRDATIGLHLKTPTVNNILGGPSIKIFNYFASAMAIFDAGLPESERFMNAVNNGISLRERTPELFTEALLMLVSNPELVKQYGMNGYQAFQQSMNWESESEKLINFYERYLLNKKKLIVR